MHFNVKIAIIVQNQHCITAEPEPSAQEKHGKLPNADMCHPHPLETSTGATQDGSDPKRPEDQGRDLTIVCFVCYIGTLIKEGHPSIGGYYNQRGSIVM